MELAPDRPGLGSAVHPEEATDFARRKLAELLDGWHAGEKPDRLMQQDGRDPEKAARERKGDLRFQEPFLDEQRERQERAAERDGGTGFVEARLRLLQFAH